MDNDSARLQSFETFPVGLVVKPDKLAQAGFYYQGDGEEVICFCCGLKNRSWPEELSVLEVHRQLSPLCKFACSDIAQREDNRTQTLPSATVSLNGRINQTTVPLYTNEDNIYYPGIPNKRPRFPAFALYSERIRSFKEWPSHHSIDPSHLAAAGLVYSGSQDRVTCFFCGGGLKNWENGDIPWIGHARWFPECAYVQHCKGKEFVNACQLSVHSGYPLSDELQLVKECIPEDGLIKDINSTAGKIVLARGYCQNDVEEAISYIRQKYGANFELPTSFWKVVGDSRELPSENVNHTVSGEPAIPQPNLIDKDSKDILSAETISFVIASNEESVERELTEQLLEENRRLKERITCKICLDNEVCILFLPCGHLVSCESCAERILKCAVCRAEIQRRMKTFF